MVDPNFQALRYDRVCRTSYSEAFLLSEDDEPLGRVDLHFGSSVVHGLLVVERALEPDVLQSLIERIDDDLVWSADRPRDDFLVTVYVGREAGVFSDHADDEEDEAAENGEGRS